MSSTTTRVKIANCSASQIVGGQSFRIATGDLALDEVRNEALNAVLVLKIGNGFVLPIEKDSEVGTQGDRSYLFRKALPDTEHTPVGPSGNIDPDMDDIPMSPADPRPLESQAIVLQVDMPDSASEEELTNFEQRLVDHKFLMVGVQADAADLSKTILGWAERQTRSIKSFALRSSSQGSSPATTPTKFDSSTHSTAKSLASGSTIFAETTTKVGDSISAGMASIGGFLGSKLGSKGLFASSESDSAAWKATKEAGADAAESVGIVGQSMGEGAKNVASGTGEAITAATKHNYGDDAAKLSEHARTTAASIGSVAATAMEQSSLGMHGAKVTQGAVSEEK